MTTIERNTEKNADKEIAALTKALKIYGGCDVCEKQSSCEYTDRTDYDISMNPDFPDDCGEDLPDWQLSQGYYN